MGGPIPTDLGNLSSLTLLALGFNQFHGQLPAGIRQAVQLAGPLRGGQPAQRTDTRRARQPVGPAIPVAERQPPQRTRTRRPRQTCRTWSPLDLNINHLTGQIPPELGNLPRLTVLNISANRLTGQIPRQPRPPLTPPMAHAKWQRLERPHTPRARQPDSSLAILDLRSNELTGQIPRELENLANLVDINLSGNAFTGCIPAKLLEVENYSFRYNNLRNCTLR